MVISALLGGWFGPTVRATASGSSDLQDSVKSFTRVLSIVERNYADPVDVDKAIYDGAIPGMLRVLDPHSNFFDPRQYALFREEQQGKYYGVGMTVQGRDNQTIVLAPFVGSPAYKAGIRPGDIIQKVDGKSCTGLTTTEVADMLKGAKGTTVHISLGREGWDKPIEVTVVRDEIPRPGVEYFTMVKPGIGYVRVSTFNETTDADLAEALKQLDVSKLDGLIIDLRNNGGGLLNQAVGMADMFLDKNEIVVSHRGRASSERRYYALRGNQGIEVPLIVLINGQSASASEIVCRLRSGSRSRIDRRRDELRQGARSNAIPAQRRYRAPSHHRALLHPERPADPARLQEYFTLRLSLQSQATSYTGSEIDRQRPAGFRSGRDYSGRCGPSAQARRL